MAAIGRVTISGGQRSTIVAQNFSPRPNVPDLKYGLCTKFVNLNKVDGSVEFASASVARSFDCKDKFFSSKNSDDDDEQSSS